MGVPGPEDIEKRAREIAMIDERDPDQFTEADWAQARKKSSWARNIRRRRKKQNKAPSLPKIGTCPHLREAGVFNDQASMKKRKPLANIWLPAA